MPEGPETKRMVDTINKDLVNKKIISTKFYHQSLDSIRTSGLSVKEVLSKGKAVVIRLNNDYSIITHNQLYGRWTSNRLNTKIISSLYICSNTITYCYHLRFVFNKSLSEGIF